MTRAAASKGAFDLIGLRGDSVVPVQVKSSRWPSPAERAELTVVDGARLLLHEAGRTGGDRGSGSRM